jgi:predicted transcriptional regulator
MTSKTQTALALMDADRNLTAYQAAKQAGITPTTLYNAIKRREAAGARVACPCCGSKVEPSRIDRSVLKDK